MDEVGPLPKSKSGNKDILTICDYATRYPEAIALPSIEASRIAKELVKLFTSVGTPEEILTDQGTNFMSTLLQKLYRLLNISRIRTSPYHLQTDGLVEKFNGTLKAMMRKFTSQNQKDWDDYLPYLLFAYREAPQKSTEFSPVELLYGRQVRGPLDVLREVWMGKDIEKTTVVTHLVQMRECLEEMTGLVRANLNKAQQKQKRAYDKKVTAQPLEMGDKVLVLVPNRQNKLQLQWQGPYQITRKVTPVDYEVTRPGRRQENEIYHANLLKKWHSTDPSSTLLALYADNGDDLEEEYLELLDLSNPQEGPLQNVASNLTKDQEAELQQLLHNFPQVTGTKLGRTTVAEHTVDVGNATPIRQRPYRVPLAMRETVKKELDKMLELEVFQASASPWALPVVLAEKGDGEIRFCVDYRKVNQVARFDAYSMPRIEEVLEQVGPAKCISTLDLAKGYWQVPMATESKEKTAFATPFGLFEFNVMPFGLHNAPATFQRLMNQVFQCCQEFAHAYIDDIIVDSGSWEEHLQLPPAPSSRQASRSSYPNASLV